MEYTHKMTAVCTIIKPSQLPWKAFDGMVEVEAVNQKRSMHACPIKRNPGAYTGGAQTRCLAADNLRDDFTMSR